MKNKRILVIIFFILSISIPLFVYNDDFLYKTEIMKITSIKTEDVTESQNTLGLREKYYDKSIEGVITNGKRKGEKVRVEYEETFSSVVTDKYQVGDKVFITDDSIDGLKRDFYISLLICIFIFLIFLVGEYKGLLSVFSAILNILIFYIGLKLYFTGINLIFLCIIESIFFAIFSLFIAGGINKKTVSAIISVLVSLLFLLLLIIVVVLGTNYSGINFNELEYLTVPVEDIIIPELLIGGIGAIMDVAITICSALAELIEKNKRISTKNLKKSAKQIGKDIMSTMVNVLFFTYLAAGLPLFVLAIRNGYSVFHYITNNISLEMTRFLVGSIGIVMTIPISTFIAIKVFRRDK